MIRKSFFFLTLILFASLEPAIGNSDLEIPVGIRPRGVAFDGSYIWVANYVANEYQGGYTVSKISTEENTVEKEVHVGARPFYILFDGKYIWVSNSGGGASPR